MRLARSLKIRSRVLSLCWSPDGRLLTAGFETSDHESGAVQWNTATWRRGRRFQQVHNPFSVASAPSGRYATAIGSQSEVCVTHSDKSPLYVAWDAKKWILQIIEVKDYLGNRLDRDDAAKVAGLINPEIAALRFSGDGLCLLVVTAQFWGRDAELRSPRQLVVLLETETGFPEFRVRLFECDAIHDADLSPDAKMIAFSSEDGAIRLLPRDTEICTVKLRSDNSPVRKVRFSRTGDSLFSTSVNGTVREWRLSDGNVIWSTSCTQSHDAVLSMELSPSGKLLAVGDAAGNFRLLTTSGTIVNTMTTKQGEIRGVAFSPCGKMIAAGGTQSIGIWELDSSEINLESAG